MIDHESTPRLHASAIWAGVTQDGGMGKITKVRNLGRVVRHGEFTVHLTVELSKRPETHGDTFTMSYSKRHAIR
jgi:hypothetical protein